MDNYKKCLAIDISIIAISVLSISIITPMLPLYLTFIGITPKVISFMISVVWGGHSIGEIFWGWIADKVGFSIPLCVGTFVSGAIFISIICTKSVLLLFIVFFFWGLARSATYGPGRGIIGSITPTAVKGTVMAITASVIFGFRSIGALPGGFMIEAWGYNSVFLLAFAILILDGVIVLINLKVLKSLKKQEREQELINDSNSNEVNYSRWQWVRPLTVQCLITTLQFVGLGIVTTFLPLLATQILDTTAAAEVGIIFAVNGIFMMIFSIPMGILTDRLGKKTIMVFGLLIMIVAMTGFYLADSLAYLIGCVIVISLSISSFNPAALARVSDSVSLSCQSTAMGLYGGVCENSGIIVGSIIGGFICSNWGVQATFLVGVVAPALGVIVCFFFTGTESKFIEKV